jgi:hypothetical protein
VLCVNALLVCAGVAVAVKTLTSEANMQKQLSFRSLLWSMWWRKQLHDFAVAVIKGTGQGCGFMYGVWLVAKMLGLQW